METYKSIIAYDGTDFKGFQRQVEGSRTVQGEFERGLKQIGWNEESIRAAGRTDAGVHASGQVVSFALNWRSETNKLTPALNANLPTDIAVRSTEKIPVDFHPRYSARSRVYRYAIICTEYRDPLRERFAWRVWPAPSYEDMSEVAHWIVGKWDFAAFGHAPTEGGHTIREVLQASWTQASDEMIFRIEANAFLYHMVRRLVAAIVKVGLEPALKTEFHKSIKDPVEIWKGKLAPPHGLCLESVTY
jgi:tRNA pseudouridine38-40 synthase